MNHPPHLILLTAPSGSGKTTIVHHLLAHHPELGFSVSACTRTPRNDEKEGRDYYFMTPESFREKIAAGAFAEYEMVYEGKYYGTLVSELERIWNSGRTPLVDIDVNGALSLKSVYPGQTLAIFIKPPSLTVLEQRLKARRTDPPEMIAERIKKASQELEFAGRFDRILVNDDLTHTKRQADQLISDFLSGLL